MFRISHNDAITLEHQVRRLFACERSGVSGMADADYLEGHPFHAAILIIAYVYANGLEGNDLQHNEFINKYEYVFGNSETDHPESKVKDYISELTTIVDKYIQ